MKYYIELCSYGDRTLCERKEILNDKKNQLLEQIAQIYKTIDYVDRKQKFYDDLLEGKSPIFKA